MWTLAIPSLLLCTSAVFTSIEASVTCADCNSGYNGTGDTNCTSLKNYLDCLETASGSTKLCALSDGNALKIKHASCTPVLPKACKCQKDLWGTNGIQNDNCTALATYNACLKATGTPQNSTCQAGFNVSTLITNADTRLVACNPCKVHNCSGHGNCTLDTTRTERFFCTCNDQYEGGQCEKEKDACSPKPCKHGGKCNVPEGGNVTVGGSNYTCDCTSGYSGLTCEEGPCAGHSCSNHGKCKADKDDQTKPLCKCDDGFSGDKCQNAGTANAIYLSSFLATLLAAHIIRMTLT